MTGVKIQGFPETDPLGQHLPMFSDSSRPGSPATRDPKEYSSPWSHCPWRQGSCPGPHDTSCHWKSCPGKGIIGDIPWYPETQGHHCERWIFDLSIAKFEWIYSRNREKRWRKTSGMWATPVGQLESSETKGCQSESCKCAVIAHTNVLKINNPHFTSFHWVKSKICSHVFHRFCDPILDQSSLV